MGTMAVMRFRLVLAGFCRETPCSDCQTRKTSIREGPVRIAEGKRRGIGAARPPVGSCIYSGPGGRPLFGNIFWRPSEGRTIVLRQKVAMMVAGLVFLSGTAAMAQSAAAKNKEGNRLFVQGKFQDAEKAYLEAQADMPGRAELSYNLGNALIKQNRYDQALSTLRQAIAKGDKNLQAEAWYNAGNALYDIGSYKEAAQAYIEGLRLNPADEDAKHNLELSLRKMQKQEQQQKQDQNSNQQNPKTSGQDEKSQGSGQQQQEQKSQSEGVGQQKPEQAQAGQPTGTFSKERALQILDALRNQELAEQRRLLEQQAHRKPSARDW